MSSSKEECIQFHTQQYDKIKEINKIIRNIYDPTLSVKITKLNNTLEMLKEEDVNLLYSNVLIDKLNVKLQIYELLVSNKKTRIDELLKMKYKIQNKIRSICFEYDLHKNCDLKPNKKMIEQFECYDEDYGHCYCLCCDSLNEDPDELFREYCSFTNEYYMKSK